MNPNNNHNDENIEKEASSAKIIKHIVFSGGATIGVSGYSFLKQSHIDGLWNIKNIESMYSTSIGAIFSLMIALQFEWDILDNYILKRPWHTVFKIDMFSLIQSIKTSGIFGINVIEDIFNPLFKAKDIKMDITLKELFEIIPIDFHVFSCQLDPLVLIDISHTTHPDWTVLEAVYCSCCLPILYIPYQKDNKTYLDGGIISHYPIYNCCERYKNKDEILGIHIRGRTEVVRDTEFGLFYYLLNIIINMIDNASVPYVKIPNEILIESDSTSLFKIYQVASNIEERLLLYNKGIELWQAYKKNWENEQREYQQRENEQRETEQKEYEQRETEQKENQQTETEQTENEQKENS